jgi:peptidoglycan hydrolase-like protein with peptidoglycan-binding domain
MAYLLNYSNWQKLHEAANGELPTADLESIPVLPTESGERHSLNPIAAEAYSKMVAAANADGIDWGITDSYRPLEVQKRLVKEKGLYSQGGLAATPGKSNHGWGSAVDLDFKKGSGDAAYTWLKNNAAKFGFTTIPREPWHWEHKESAKTVKSGESTATILTQADTVSDTKSKSFNDKVDNLMTTPSVATILKYKDGINYMTAADKEEIRKQLGGVSMSQLDDWVAGKISDRDFIALAVTTMLSQKNNNSSLQPVQSGIKLLRSGSTGEDVKEIQTKLKELGYLTKEPTGEFDKDTYNAVKAFQTNASIGVDGIVGPQTYGALFGDKAQPAKVGAGQLTGAYSTANDNNPFNLRPNSGEQFNGYIGKKEGFRGTQSIGEFAVFDTITNGIRAGMKNLEGYFTRRNLKTISQIINTYAPGGSAGQSQADTNSYVNSVLSYMQKNWKPEITATSQLAFSGPAETDPDNIKMFKTLVSAIAKQEGKLTPGLASSIDSFDTKNLA